jgi:hypothetical protein
MTMRALVTGQVGLDKKAFLEGVIALAAARYGRSARLANIGERMYAEAPDIPQGRILDLPLSRLTALRRSVLKDVLGEASAGRDIIVNTHATFRWRHGLFFAFDYDQTQALAADLYVTLVDNIDSVHARLLRDGHADHTLKDLMVWREEEVLATELLSVLCRGHGHFYILARGQDGQTGSDALVKLMFQPYLKKAYLSFPMSNISDGAAQAAILGFRSEMRRFFTCFDPGDLEEKYLGPLALASAQAGNKFVTVTVAGRPLQIDTSELLSILPDIDGQIYARDFKLIDQADMIVSLIPELPDQGGPNRPGISSGVERELQHAHEAGKDVFVIWQAGAPPSPFVTETATRVFASLAEAIDYFLANGYVPPAPSGMLFG